MAKIGSFTIPVEIPEYEMTSIEDIGGGDGVLSVAGLPDNLSVLLAAIIPGNGISFVGFPGPRLAVYDGTGGNKVSVYDGSTYAARLPTGWSWLGATV